jgi:hypothetical protein
MTVTLEERSKGTSGSLLQPAQKLFLISREAGERSCGLACGRDDGAERESDGAECLLTMAPPNPGATGRKNRSDGESLLASL